MRENTPPPADIPLPPPSTPLNQTLTPYLCALYGQFGGVMGEPVITISRRGPEYQNLGNIIVEAEKCGFAVRVRACTHRPGHIRITFRHRAGTPSIGERYRRYVSDVSDTPGS